ncbi:MAG: TIGR00153 family protein [Wenzhouxiangella sp.]|jgi:predicted phosphate transport protein (TIGR00153 family)|nr:TIGR00153 family protein [Wenzhouxiangella sp.]
MNPTGYISRVFGQSPVRPLQEHFEKAAACAGKLPDFVRAAQTGDWETAAEMRKSIVNLEHEADDLKRELRLNLPRSLFMPVARTDVLEMLSVQDRIANKARDISGLMLGRRMVIPDALHDLYLSFVDRCLEAVGQAHKTVNELDELFETGFRGSEIDLVMGMIKKLDEIENDSDTLQVEFRAKLFEIEKDLPPIDVMFLYKIIDWTGDLGDLAQRVGSRLHLMIAR